MLFLSIITRHYIERPNFFAKCKESVEMQTCDDYEHIILEDTVGRGVAWANKQFERNAHKVTGEYVFILDDDDQLIADDFVESIRQIGISIAPDLIVVKMNHGKRLGVLPRGPYWGNALPPFSRIGVSAVVPRRKIWTEAVQHFAPRIGGDYPFIEKCFGLSENIIWYDRVMSEVQDRPMFGRGER